MKNYCVRMLSVTNLVITLAVVASAGRCYSQDLFPPAWRGQPGTTYAAWDFTTPSNNPLPDQYFNPYGQPELNVTPGSGMSYQPMYGGHIGVWPLSGLITIGIPNNPVANPYKDIWLQLTWAPEQAGGRPTINESHVGQNYQLIQETILGPTGELPVNGNWVHSTYLFHIEPNPAFETIQIWGGIWADQVVVDTFCIPEPSVFAMLSIGGLLLFRRRNSS
jgi:hypothetical protein